MLPNTDTWIRGVFNPVWQSNHKLQLNSMPIAVLGKAINRLGVGRESEQVFDRRRMEWHNATPGDIYSPLLNLH